MTQPVRGDMPPAQAQGDSDAPIVAVAVDEDLPASNQRSFTGSRHLVFAAACAGYTLFHLAVMNLYPLESWTYRLLHLAGGLALGFLLFGAHPVPGTIPGTIPRQHTH